MYTNMRRASKESAKALEVVALLVVVACLQGEFTQPHAEHARVVHTSTSSVVRW